MRQNLHIIVNCTERKNARVPEELRLSSIPTGTLRKRAMQWLQRLKSYKSEGVTAGDLYAGDHWGIVRNLPTLAVQANFTPHLWVISAGYGLVHCLEKIHPYSATFSAGHCDSILSNSTATGTNRSLLHKWWELLGKSPVTKGPRSLTQLVRQNERAYYLVVASPAYLNAISEDLTEALSLLKKPRFVIVSSRLAAVSKRWEQCLIPSDARLQEEVGGARSSLNARVAERVLIHATEAGFDPITIRKKVENQIAASPKLVKYDRQRADDESVSTYIIRGLQETPELSCTAMLKRYRTEGKACEQKRFKNLYWEVKKQRCEQDALLF
jgi:hypothetical protein